MKVYEIFWYILSRLAVSAIVVIAISTGCSQYKSEAFFIPGLLLGIIIFLIIDFSKQNGEGIKK